MNRLRLRLWYWWNYETWWGKLRFKDAQIKVLRSLLSQVTNERDQYMAFGEGLQAKRYNFGNCTTCGGVRGYCGHSNNRIRGRSVGGT